MCIRICDCHAMRMADAAEAAVVVEPFKKKIISFPQKQQFLIMKFVWQPVTKERTNIHQSLI